MEFKLLYRGEPAGQALIAGLDQSENILKRALAMLWAFSIEQVPSVAFGFLADKESTVELSQPIILDLSRLGEQSAQIASDKVPYLRMLDIELDSPTINGWIRGSLYGGQEIVGNIYRRSKPHDSSRIMLSGRIRNISEMWGRLRVDIYSQGIRGHVRMPRMMGDSINRGYGEFYFDIDQDKIQGIIHGYGSGVVDILLDTTGTDGAVNKNIIYILIDRMINELNKREVNSLDVSLRPLVLPIDSPIFSTLLNIPTSNLREASLLDIFNLASMSLLTPELLPSRRDIRAIPLLSKPAPTYKLKRYPSLDAPEQVFVGEPFTLKIGLGKEAAAGTSGLVILENLPPDQESFPVEFEVHANDFTFTDDNNNGILKVTRDEQLVYIDLELTPLPIEEEYHLADLHVVFYFSGKRCGRADRALLISAHKSLSAGKLPPGTELASQTESHIEFVFGTKVPDLTFELYKMSNDNTSFDCFIRSSHLVNYPRKDLRCQLNLGLTPATYINNLYNQIAQQHPGIPASNCVSAIGDVLYEVAPECFKRAYWKLCDDLGDKFQTIQIYSDEPWIPWELMRPMRKKEDDTYDERPFLGVEHSVGRWLNTTAGAPPQIIQAAPATVIAPDYLSAPLPCAKKEAAWLENAIHATKLTPATKANVIEFLQDGEAHIIHFSCHGKSLEDANVGGILLEDGTLSAFELKSREIRLGLSAKYRPLVFINACESGRIGLTLGGVGGLASAFVDISCSAVIGSLWPIDDEDAFDVVQMFYSLLLKADRPLSIAEIMREIRKEFDNQKRDTFLAYTFFGDPHATVTLQQPSTRRGSDG